MCVCQLRHDSTERFGADGESRTLNLLFLKQAPLPIGLRRHGKDLAAEVGVEPTSLGSAPSCLPIGDSAAWLYSDILKALVNPARLERAASGSADRRSYSAELRVHMFGGSGET